MTSIKHTINKDDLVADMKTKESITMSDVTKLKEYSEHFSSMPILHIYGQEAWHDDVVIVGNHDGIKKLYEACVAALADEIELDDRTAFVNDGEGFGIYVAMVSEPKDILGLKTPYSEWFAQTVPQPAIESF
jgi:N-acyl-D-aspartate/D-glutamate deacylase